MKRIIYLLLFCFVTGCFNRTPEKTTHKGESLPAFTLLLADSSTYFNTASLTTDRPVVLFYFGPRCPFSRAQMQRIIDDFSRVKNIEFVIFTTSSFYEMKWFYNNYKLHQFQNFKIGIDYRNFFMNYFGVGGVPYIAIYGKDRKLKDAFEGVMSVRQIKKIATFK